ncbi:unnamed protein product [Mytilus edulis]|uniref:DUF3447 domain-containing protein n=1 Tax=Mytilus edulis TaxID=6550 RepID=A0A8S3R684_MYTED|nr:unnamed protein product [Mytilus edulis]
MKEEKDQTSFAVLALFVIYNNCITDESLSPTSGIKSILSDIAEECELSTLLNIKVVRSHLEFFRHSYVKKIGSSYMIMHDKLFDIFVSFYGEHFLDIILTHCSYPVIYTRFQLHHVHSVEDTDEYMIKVPLEKEAEYFQRLFHVSKAEDYAYIFSHNHFKCRIFQQKFLTFLSEDQDCRDLCLSLSETESSPLFITAARGYTDMIKVLLDIGMNVNVSDDFELTPLSYAAGGGCFETVKLLLENNGDMNKQTKNKPILNFTLAAFQLYSVYYKATFVPIDDESYKTFTEIVERLPRMDKKDGDLRRIPCSGTPLFLATIFGHTDIVKLLSKQNCDIYLHDWFNISPLYIATLCNHVDIVAIMLEHGCDINTCNEGHESPLFKASERGACSYGEIIVRQQL